MGLDMYLHADRVLKCEKATLVHDLAHRYDELFKDAHKDAGLENPTAWDTRDYLGFEKQEMYISGWAHERDFWKRDIFHELLDALSMRTCMHPRKPKWADQQSYPADCNSIYINRPWHGCPYWSVSVNIGYWRKASAVHGWFVEHVQDGEDNCGEYAVSLEQLYDLRTRVQMALNGERKLEPVQGFFFNSNDDEYYNMYMHSTITTVNSAIDMYYRQHDGLSIKYNSSW
jgi:hypothetical protein